MGYYINSYAINKTLIQRSLGSKDEQILNNVLESKSLKYYERRDPEHYNILKAAIEQMIFGEPYDKGNEPIYWYAFKEVCHQLGKSLTTSFEIKLGVDTDIVDELLLSEYGIKINIENLLLNNKADFGLPKHNDFPVTGLWNKADLHEIHSLIKDIHISDDQLEIMESDDFEKWEGSRIIKKIGEDVVYCLENELVLISFCH